jgi:hypothetical protein
MAGSAEAAIADAVNLVRQAASLIVPGKQ